jgi:hypothetical protein
MSTLCFLYLFLKLFTDEAVFIEDGILFHSSTTLCEKKFHLTSSLMFSGPAALLAGRLALSQTMIYCSLCHTREVEGWNQVPPVT